MLGGDSLDGKEKVLTFVGRVCLIKYVLTTLSLFNLSFLKAPIGNLENTYQDSNKISFGLRL